MKVSILFDCIFKVQAYDRAMTFTTIVIGIAAIVFLTLALIRR